MFSYAPAGSDQRKGPVLTFGVDAWQLARGEYAIVKPARPARNFPR